MNTANLIIATIISAMISFGASFAYFSPKLSELNNQVELRPPVLIVDMAKLAIESVPVGSGTAAIDEHFRNTQDVIDKFSDAGFLVLSRENIISAPQDLMLNSDDIPLNIHMSKGAPDV